MRRHTIEFINSEFVKRRFTLLTKEYENQYQKLYYICPNGHECSISWNHFKAGNGCPYCAGNIKQTIEFIRSDFEKNSYILLTKEYKNAHQKLDYICPKGHKHCISWSSWLVGHRCPYCAGMAKPTIEFIKNDFMDKECKLLTNEYINNRQKLYYICSNGHEHSITWHDWVSGYGCPICAIINNSGENHYNWKGGVTSANDKIRQSFRYAVLRASIFERDGYTCQMCLRQVQDLEAHHIYPFAMYPDLRFESWNLITLCKQCHAGIRGKEYKFINQFLGISLKGITCNECLSNMD